MYCTQVSISPRGLFHFYSSGRLISLFLGCTLVLVYCTYIVFFPFWDHFTFSHHVTFNHVFVPKSQSYHKINFLFLSDFVSVISYCYVSFLHVLFFLYSRYLCPRQRHVPLSLRFFGFIYLHNTCPLWGIPYLFVQSPFSLQYFLPRLSKSIRHIISYHYLLTSI